MKNATLFDFLKSSNAQEIDALTPSVKSINFIKNYSRSVDKISSNLDFGLPVIKN